MTGEQSIRAHSFEGKLMRVHHCDGDLGVYMELGDLCDGYQAGDPAKYIPHMAESMSCGEVLHYGGDPARALVHLCLLTGWGGDICLIREACPDRALAIRFTDWIMDQVLPNYPHDPQLFQKYSAEWTSERLTLTSVGNVVLGPWSTNPR